MKREKLVPMRWADGCLYLLDQRALPHKEEWLRLETFDQVAEAIRSMAVRGAPAIGLAAAYGVAMGLADNQPIQEIARTLTEARPTAVNLAWAVQRVATVMPLNAATALQEAVAMEHEDRSMNEEIGRRGASLVPQGANILTLCNTGAIATAGHGSALGIIRSAHEAGKEIHVWSCETRPRQQGLKLTTYELLAEGIPFHAVADSAAGFLMAQSKVDLVLVGADRIAKNGDTANKIGTYALAVLANYHQVPFYVAAPSSTFDLDLADGKGIPIEERAAEELTHYESVAIAPSGTPVYNPGFDVTPHALISAIISEVGIARPPYLFA